MKILTLITAALLLAAVPSLAANVYNVDLKSVGDSDVTGTATTISNEITGATPYFNVEVNMHLNKMPSSNMIYEGWLVDNDVNYKLSLGAFNGMMLSTRQQLLSFGSNMPYDSIAVSIEPVHDTNPMPSMIIAMGDLPGDKVSAADFMRVAVLPEDEMFQRRVVVQRFGLTDDQVTALRMDACSYPLILAVANAASRTNRSPSEIAQMLSQGQSWDQIASSSNTTVAMLFEPIPMEMVAGFRAEVRPSMAPVSMMMQPPVFYRQLPNSRRIITQDYWNLLSRAGYSWRDVAVAANIASMTGENVDDLLRMARIQGMTWKRIAFDRAIDVDKAMDVSEWPFGEKGQSKREVREMREMRMPSSMPPAAPPSMPTY